METRSIAIGLVAIVAAFAAAFGLAKSGQSKTETAGAGVKAQSIQVAAPAAVSGVEVGGTLPALKAERKAPAKKKKKSTPATNNNSTTPSSTPTPSPNNNTTQPSNPVPTQPTNPTPSTPKPNKPSTPKPEEPVQSGGDDG
jgi:hypothetical protein